MSTFRTTLLATTLLCLAPGTPGTAASPREVVDVTFAEIKIRFQPPPPKYPAAAREARIQGTVVVELTVDESGIPEQVKALEGPEELTPTAIEYAKEWRFEPYEVKGKAVKARFKLTMPFKLH